MQQMANYPAAMRQALLKSKFDEYVKEIEHNWAQWIALHYATAQTGPILDEIGLTMLKLTVDRNGL